MFGFLRDFAQRPARLDAGRMRCLAETLGKGVGEETAGEGRETSHPDELWVRSKFISEPLDFGVAPLGVGELVKDNTVHCQ
jgi:hypothetical protein